MRYRYLLGAFAAFFIFFSTITAAEAAYESNRRVISKTQSLINNPSEACIEDYIALMKRRVVIDGLKRNFEAQADDIRSILYFLRRDKESEDYIKYSEKLNKTYSKIGFQNTQYNRLEIARNLYLEEKYFASAYEFLELAGESYCKEVCYEYLGDISNKFLNPNSAVVFYQKALEIEGENYNITYKLGKTYKELQKNDEAREYFETTINLTQDEDILNDIIQIYETELSENLEDETAYEILGLSYQKLKEYEKTYELFSKAINLKPEDIFLKYYLGNLLYEMGEYPGAIEVYNSIINSNPYETQIRIARAKSFNKIGKLQQAIKDYQVVLALYPNSKQAQYGLYKMLWGKKNPDEIIKLFYPLNKNFIPNAEFYNNLAGILYQKNMVKDSISIYKKAIKASPYAPKSYIQLYKIYELEGDSANAYELAKEAYKNIPNNSEIKNIYEYSNKYSSANKNSIALSYMSNKEYSKAIKIYNQIQPKDASVYESLAVCYKQLKNYNEAIKSLSQAIKLDPVNSDLYYNTALLYLDLNNKKTAETYLNKAIGLEKTNLKARKLLSFIKQQEIDTSLNKAYALYKRKDFNGTLAELNRAEKLYPNNPDVFYYKGLTYSELNDINGAAKNFKKTLSLDRSYYTCHYYLAEILEKQGKEKQALEEYERFLGAEVTNEKMRKKAQDKVIQLGQKYY